MSGQAVAVITVTGVELLTSVIMLQLIFQRYDVSFFFDPMTFPLVQFRVRTWSFIPHGLGSIGSNNVLLTEIGDKLNDVSGRNVQLFKSKNYN